MNEMKREVTRIVMPIWASTRRKEKMREEMMAHLAEVVEQEKDRGLAEEEALRRALERLGEPAELRRTLQGSVPMLERLSYLRIPFLTPSEKMLSGFLNQRPGESALRHSARLTGFYGLCFCGVFVLGLLYCGAIGAAKGRGFPDLFGKQGVAHMLLATCLPLTLACFPILLLGHAIHRASLDRPLRLSSWLRAWGCMALMAIVMWAELLLMILIGRPELVMAPGGWLAVLNMTLKVPFPSAIYLIVPLGAPIMVFAVIHESRRRKEWDEVAG